jgi:ribosomal protein L29
MKIELGAHIIKRLKMLDEFADLGKEELKEGVIELIEELLEEYAEDNITNNENHNSDDYE